MADPLSTDKAKAALADAARGRVRRATRPTTREAKDRLRQVASAAGLTGMVRTQPFLACALAAGYGAMLGGSRTGHAQAAGWLYHVLTSLLAAR